ncbi:MAG: hypothetical protein HKO57_05330 [Akkermansiaceae bacterium]|nr:hypothetical protein [Akkermansiaceae bacterium]
MSLLLVYLSFQVFPHVLGTVLLALTFFVASGALISMFYEEFKAKGAYLAYTLDMAGGALACLAAVPLLNLTGPVSMTVGAGAVCALLSAMSWGGGNRRGVFLVGTLVAVAMVILSAGIHFRFIAEFPDRKLFAHAKPLTQRAATDDHGKIVDFEWSSVGRADLYEDPDHEELKWIYYDQTNPSIMLRESMNDGERDFLRSRFAYFPISILDPDEMLVVGAGGGYEIKLAKLAGVDQIDAVEINPAIIRLVKRRQSFTGPLYETGNVNLSVTEGRTFLMRSKKRYDLIQMSLVLTGSADSATHATLENYLYTTESFTAIMRRLSDRGCLAIIDDSADRTVRQFLTALAVLQESGVEQDQALKQICVFYNLEPGPTAYRNLLLVFPNEPGEAMCRQAVAEAKRLNLQPLWVPNLVAGRPFSDVAELGMDQFLEKQQIELSPVTDDQPYFFDFTKGPWKKLKVAWPFLSLAAFAAVFAGLIRFGKRTRPHDWRTHLTAFLIGLGFMFVELGLIQKQTIAIGSPTKILSVLLFSILLWCGIGSQIGSRITRISRRRISVFCWVVAAVNGIFVYWLQDHYLLESISSGNLRIIAVILLLAPLGVVMGMPFPSLLNSVKTGEDRQLGVIWGINGLASLAGANLWIVCSLLAGGSVTLLCGSVLYVLAGLSAWKVRAS